LLYCMEMRHLLDGECTVVGAVYLRVKYQWAMVTLRESIPAFSPVYWWDFSVIGRILCKGQCALKATISRQPCVVKLYLLGPGRGGMAIRTPSSPYGYYSPVLTEECPTDIILLQ
jgi:hypothetical protein